MRYNFIPAKQFILLVICLFAACFANAQGFFSGSRGNFDIDDFYIYKFGGTAGVSFSNAITSSNPIFKASGLTGFHIGGTATVPIFDPLSLVPEVLFSEKGFSATSAAGNFSERTQFVDVPLLVKCNLGSVLAVYLGPQLTFLTNTRDTYAPGFNFAQLPYIANSGGKNGFAGVLGLSYNFNPNLDVHARYTLDVQPNYQNGFQNNLSPYRNQVIQFGFAVKFF